MYYGERTTTVKYLQATTKAIEMHQKIQCQAKWGENGVQQPTTGQQAGDLIQAFEQGYQWGRPAFNKALLKKVGFQFATRGYAEDKELQ